MRRMLTLLSLLVLGTSAGGCAVHGDFGFADWPAPAAVRGSDVDGPGASDAASRGSVALYPRFANEW